GFIQHDDRNLRKPFPAGPFDERAMLPRRLDETPSDCLYKSGHQPKPAAPGRSGMSDRRIDNARRIRAPRGSALSAKSWLTEAPLRMLMNNLDDEVAEKPQELVVYGGIGRAARDWPCFDRIVSVLKELEEDETLLVQSGKPVGVFKTHRDA